MSGWTWPDLGLSWIERAIGLEPAPASAPALAVKKKRRRKHADTSAPAWCEGDYMLRRASFELITRRFGHCSVDAFASPATAQLPRFWTREPCAESDGTNAFAQDWAGERLLLHPPVSLLPDVVRLLVHNPRAAGVVVAPAWPHAKFHREVCSPPPPRALRAATLACLTAWAARVLAAAADRAGARGARVAAGRGDGGGATNGGLVRRALQRVAGAAARRHVVASVAAAADGAARAGQAA